MEGPTPDVVVAVYKTQEHPCIKGSFEGKGVQARLVSGHLFWCGKTKGFHAKLQGGRLSVDHWWDEKCSGLTGNWADGAVLDRVE